MIRLYVIQLRKFSKNRNSKFNNNHIAKRNYIYNNKKIIFDKVSVALSMIAVFFIIVTTIVIARGAINLFLIGSDSNVIKLMIEDTIPILQVSTEKEPFKLPPFGKILFGFEPFDPKSIISSQVFAFNTILDKSSELNHTSQPIQPEENEELGQILETTIHPVSPNGYADADGVYIKNSTTYSIDANQLLKQPLNFNKGIKGPKVLITHAHSSESFKPTDANYYKPSDPDRTQDPRFNVERVGEEMTKILQQANIEVIHDTKLHDYPNYNGSYKNSLATIEEYLNKYPSIQIVLDIHRDAMSRGTNTILKAVTEIDGKKAAQVMLVCGTDLGGLDHPHWRNNLAFAMKFQQSMNKIYPTLSRPIDLRNERFNMHTTNNSLILEIGSNGNTLEEAVLGGRAAANALARLLKGQ